MYTAAVRVGVFNGNFIINPTTKEVINMSVIYTILIPHPFSPRAVL